MLDLIYPGVGDRPGQGDERRAGLGGRAELACEQVDIEEADPKDEQLLAADSEQILNRMPLALLKQASQSEVFPPKVRQQLERVVRVRSVLLQPSPSFDDVYKLLKTPGLHFQVDTGFGRYTKDIAAIDPFRDNWWCAVSPRAQDLPAFLTPAELDQAKREWDRLSAIPAAPNWLSAQTLLWSQKIPDDPRIPEALHLAVRATRYGCSDKDTGNFSKRAFDLLHRRYPNSPWTTQTKYWFK